MPVITNQQLNSLKGGGRELFPALSVDLTLSTQKIVKLSITVMFTGLQYNNQSHHAHGNQLSKHADDISYVDTNKRYQNQSMQLNLTSNLPNTENKKNLHAFVCPAIDDELKIFHCNALFDKQQRWVSITPILNTSQSMIEGIKGACGQYIISYL